LLLAKKEKLIPSFKDLLDDLEQRANFYLRPELKEQFLKQSGE